MHAHEYALNATWRPLLKDLGVRPSNVLRRAGLPEDLLSRPSVRLATDAFFRFWESVEIELDDPLFPIRLGQAVKAESFSPPIFAALCCPNLLTAAQRISQYKPLIAPIRMAVTESQESVAIALEWLDTALMPPASLVAAELVFLVCLARLATREPMQPVSVVTSNPPQPVSAYESFFGTRVSRDDIHCLRFSRKDAMRPFLTANEGMWQVFEPELRRRLTELDESATVAERVRAALLEGLPSGRVSMDSVARRLSLSKRTLQRRLSAEATTFQQVLQDTRETLATHYLQRTQLATAEISFLLGFEEPNSFYRAFSSWTGQTPDNVRRSGVH